VSEFEIGLREIQILLHTNNREPVTPVPEFAASFSEGAAVGLIDEAQPRKLAALDRFKPRQFLPWVSRGGLTIVDQGLISGSNFIVSILLARWFTAELYGAYAIAFGIYVLLTLVYGAMVLEPMSVFGGKTYRHSLREYCGSLLWIHLTIGLGICLAVGISAAIARVLGMNGLPGALLGVAVASPWVLLLSLVRRVYYLKMLPSRAATSSLIYCVLMLSGLFVFYRQHLLSPLTAFILMGAGALFADVILLAQLRKELTSGEPVPGLRDTWVRHWRYGRWALASCFASWVPTYIFYPLVSSFSGMAHSGELRALMNFFSPLDQILAALSLLFLPYAAGVQAEKGHQGARALAGKLMFLSVTGAVIYWALLIGFRRPIFQLLYSGKYTEVAYLLPALALGSIFWSAAYGPAIALRAMEAPSSVFMAYSTAALISLLVGIPVTRAYGLKGAIWAGNVAEGASFLVIMLLLRRRFVQYSLAS